MMQKGCDQIFLLVGVLIVGVSVLFIPIPYYQKENMVCKMGQLNCPQRGWYFGQSLWQNLLSRWLAKSSAETYACPEGGYVNCMPVVKPDKKYMCEKNFIAWARLNCPGFRGTVY